MIAREFYKNHISVHLSFDGERSTVMIHTHARPVLGMSFASDDPVMIASVRHAINHGKEESRPGELWHLAQYLQNEYGEFVAPRLLENLRMVSEVKKPPKTPDHFPALPSNHV